MEPHERLMKPLHQFHELLRRDLLGLKVSDIRISLVEEDLKVHPCLNFTQVVTVQSKMFLTALERFLQGTYRP